MPAQWQRPLNTIFFGPPGTGKSYRTFTEAVEICDGPGRTQPARVHERFRELKRQHRIEVVTFHQSYGYEEFIEGLRPVLAKDDPKGTAHTIKYEIRPGVFKGLCTRACMSAAISASSTINLAEARCWKMSLGKSHPSPEKILEVCLTKSWLLLGHGRGLNFSDCDNKKDIEDAVTAANPKIIGDAETCITAVDRFKNKMSTGDLVIVSNSPRTFRAIGRVVGEYSFLSDRATYAQMRPVEWLKVFDSERPRQMIWKEDFLEAAINELNKENMKPDILSSLISPGHNRRMQNYVLIIDEINRGNISKILGETIALLESDKRIGCRNELQIKLPYSGEEFGVPANLYVIGTMNSADRSIAFLDVALRRRFSFVEVVPEPAVLRGALPNHGIIDKVDVVQLLELINQRIELLLDRDHMIGHAYFIEVKTLAALRAVFIHNVIPLLQEYFYGDWPKICAVLGCPYSRAARTANKKPLISAERLSIKLLGALDGDDLIGVEDKLRFRVNREFAEAQESELLDFFESIMTAMRERKQRALDDTSETDEADS